MSKLPPSDADGVWARGGPITDIGKALELLNTPRGPRKSPFLVRRDIPDGEIWEIVGPNHGQSGAEVSLPIDPALARRLTRERFVEPDQDKASDGSYPKWDVFTLSDMALEVCGPICRRIAEGLADAAEHFTRTFVGSNEEAQAG